MQSELLVGDLGATLTVPEKPRAAALILQGSGVHDRNGAMPAFGFRSNLYERLARGLGERGIATLRYDKRGHDLPANAPRNYSLASRMEDAKAALMVLVSRREVAGLPIRIVGHSEGALIASKVACDCQLNLRVVSLAAPFGNVFELNKFRAQKLATGANTALQARGRRALEFYERLEAMFRAGDQLPPPEFLDFAAPFRDAGFAGWESFEWLREHWQGKADCDPTAIGIAMLIVQGGRDNRLWDDNSERWRDWCQSRPLAKFVDIADMGHDLNDARRKAFVVHEEVISAIAAWI